jgi:hypothetical protein
MIDTTMVLHFLGGALIASQLRPSVTPFIFGLIGIILMSYH